MYYTDSQINCFYKSIVDGMREEDYVPDVVIGLSRGGLDMGVKFSHYFGCKFVPLVWQSRDAQDKDLTTLQTILNKYSEAGNILFVDDICDTGLTLTEVSNHIPRNINAKFAVIVEKPDSNFKCDWRGTWIQHINTWYVFPWEDWYDNTRKA